MVYKSMVREGWKHWGKEMSEARKQWGMRGRGCVEGDGFLESVCGIELVCFRRVRMGVIDNFRKMRQ
jgi:hypothetical protein